MAAKHAGLIPPAPRWRGAGHPRPGAGRGRAACFRSGELRCVSAAHDASTQQQRKHVGATAAHAHAHAHVHAHVHKPQSGAQRARHGRTSDWAVSRLVTACARHHGSAFAVGTLQEMVKLLRCADRQLPCKRDFVRHMKLRSPQASSGTMATPRLRTPAASPRCRPGADAATPAPSHCHRPSRSHRRPRDHPPRWSVQAGQLPMAQLLVKEGANLHVRDREQWTPLHYACHGALRPPPCQTLPNHCAYALPAHKARKTHARANAAVGTASARVMVATRVGSRQ